MKTITRALNSINYSVTWKVLDAKSYVPQHRERIFIVGFDALQFPLPGFEYPATDAIRGTALKDILEKRVPGKYVLTDHLWNYLKEYAERHRKKGNGFSYGLVDPRTDKLTRTLSARYYKDGSEILVRRKKGNPRRLTPRECARLMGFPDSFVIPVSDMQAYRQFGNAVVPAVVRNVALNALKVLENGQNFEGEKKLEHVTDPIPRHITRTRS